MNAKPAKCDGECCTTTEDGSAACALPARQQTSQVRSGVMFAIACLFSPCCAPLLVPPALALLAGTPLAALVGANLGWVYGGLTAVSVISLALGLYGLRQRTKRAGGAR